MAHIVLCPICGRKFDADAGAVYDPRSRRYTCLDCAQRQRAANVDAVKSKVQVRMFACIVVGAGCLIYSVYQLISGKSFWFAAALGIAFLAAALIPYFLVKRQADTLTAQGTEICPACGSFVDSTLLFCPNCGARIERK